MLQKQEHGSVKMVGELEEIIQIDTLNVKIQKNKTL